MFLRWKSSIKYPARAFRSKRFLTAQTYGCPYCPNPSGKSSPRSSLRFAFETGRRVYSAARLQANRWHEGFELRKGSDSVRRPKAAPCQKHSSKAAKRRLSSPVSQKRERPPSTALLRRDKRCEQRPRARGSAPARSSCLFRVEDRGSETNGRFSYGSSIKQKT